MNTGYLFTSARLGFRNWRDTDIPLLAAINADPDVMEFFPGVKTVAETEAFVNRMQLQMNERGYCYFAVDKLEDGAFIGFIGLSEQTFEAGFTPCTDIGWRLDKREWNKGFATEGAKRALEYGFRILKKEKIYAVAPKVNLPSEQVMRKAGMAKVSEFVHPLLADDQRLRLCVLYRAVNGDIE